jgi:hypothetical protein
VGHEIIITYLDIFFDLIYGIQNMPEVDRGKVKGER